MAPKKQQKKIFDYSDLEKGMTVQAEADGIYYAAQIVQVSTAKNRSKAPVKVSYKGYEGYDEWVGGDRLRSKALKVETPEKKAASGSKKEKTKGTYTVYYHTACKGFYGRALAAAAMLEEAEVTYEFKEPSDFDGKGFAPPMIASPSGAKCSQTAAISLTLGRELGLSPKGSVLLAKAFQLVEDFNDLFSGFDKGDDDRKKKWLQHIEDNLTAKYFCGDAITFVDFHGIMVFTNIAQKSPELMEGYPKLKAWIDTVKDSKGYQKLKATGIPFLPEKMGLVNLL